MQNNYPANNYSHAPPEIGQRHTPQSFEQLRAALPLQLPSPLPASTPASRPSHVSVNFKPQHSTASFCVSQNVSQNANTLESAAASSSSSSQQPARVALSDQFQKKTDIDIPVASNNNNNINIQNGGSSSSSNSRSSSSDNNKEKVNSSCDLTAVAASGASGASSPSPHVGDQGGLVGASYGKKKKRPLPLHPSGQLSHSSASKAEGQAEAGGEGGSVPKACRLEGRST